MTDVIRQAILLECYRSTVSDAHVAQLKRDALVMLTQLETTNAELLEALGRFIERHDHEVKIYGKSFYDNEINVARETLSRHLSRQNVGIIHKAEEQESKNRV